MHDDADSRRRRQRQQGTGDQKRTFQAEASVLTGCTTGRATIVLSANIPAVRPAFQHERPKEKKNQHRRKGEDINPPGKCGRHVPKRYGKADTRPRDTAKGIRELVERRGASTAFNRQRFSKIQRQKDRKQSQPKAKNKTARNRKRENIARRTNKGNGRQRTSAGQSHRTDTPKTIREKPAGGGRQNHGKHRSGNEEPAPHLANRHERNRRRDKAGGKAGRERADKRNEKRSHGKLSPFT